MARLQQERSVGSSGRLVCCQLSWQLGLSSPAISGSKLVNVSLICSKQTGCDHLQKHTRLCFWPSMSSYLLVSQTLLNSGDA